MPSADPRILVLSSWAPPMIGGPQNFYNLFSCFPAESYVILTAANAIDSVSWRTGDWLAGRYVFCDRAESAGKGTDAGTPRDGSSGDPGRLLRWLGRIPVVGKGVYDLIWLVYYTVRMVASALRLVRPGGIDILLGISDRGAALLATYIVHKRTRVPYVVYLFDLYRGNRTGAVHRIAARVLEPRLLKRAAAVVVTNEEAGNFLRSRYGSSFRSSLIENSAFPEDYERVRAPYDPTPPYTILFTGHVYWAQEGAVRNLIRAMDRLADLPVVLDLYIPGVSDAVRDAVRGKNNIRILSAPPSEMPRIQSSATLLFLPLSWDASGKDIVATASPGKFTDYMAAGRPMLVHAPDYSFVARYVKEKGIGLVVDENDPGVLADAIRNFLKDPSVGRRYVEKGLSVFREGHDARKNASRLWELLCEREEAIPA